MTGDEYVATYLAGTAESNEALVDLIIDDMGAIGLGFVAYEEGMTGGYIVALVVNPEADYHWYRMDSDGTWSHKQGQMPIIQIGYYVDENRKIQYNTLR